MSTIATDANGFKTIDPAPTVPGADTVQDNTNLTSQYVTSLTAGIASNDLDITALQNAVTGISVTNHGTEGDGTTDDYDALVAAEEAANTEGVWLLFPPGTYLIETSITFRVPVLFLGGVLKRASGVTATFNEPYMNPSKQACFDEVDATGKIALAATNTQEVSTEDWSNADFGDRANRAIGAMPATKGILRLPERGEIEYAITIEVPDGVRLIGTHHPIVAPQSAASKDTGTHLTYTGSGNAIEVSTDDGERHGGMTFEHFLLECNNVNATGGIISKGQHYRTLYRNIAIDGPGEGTSFVGIDIPKFAGPTSSWIIGEGVRFRNCNVCLQLENVNALTWTAGTCMDSVRGVSMVVGPSGAECVGCTFIGTEMERIGTGFDLQDSFATSIFGGYYESEGVNDLFISAGGTVGGRAKVTLVAGVFMRSNGAPGGEYVIKLHRATQFTIVGGYASDQTINVINNVIPGTDDNYAVYNLTSNSVEIWDDTTGVQITNNMAGDILYPNMPTSDPSVAGELWHSSGDVKISL